MMIKNCKRCDSEFKPYRSNNLFCSLECGEKYRYSNKKFTKENREQIRINNKLYRDKNRKVITKECEYCAEIYQLVRKDQKYCNDKCQRKAYKLLNKGKERANKAKRRVAEGNSAPIWVNWKVIESIYIEARQLEVVDKIRYHVDHIVPLSHPNVCGLHVPWNLQIMTAEANMRKSNKFDMVSK